MAHFDHEYIPERAVHAKGAGESRSYMYMVFIIFFSINAPQDYCLCVIVYLRDFPTAMCTYKMWPQIHLMHVSISNCMYLLCISAPKTVPSG